MIVDGYVRVSQVAGRSGERFISPAVQRDQIEGWAQMRGALVGEVFEELDQSGGRADRPLLMRAIERIEAGVTHGLVVAKLDRFGRSLTDGLAAIGRIQAAGGVFVSVQDGLDLTTDTGRLVLRVMLTLAEFELDRVRSNWMTASLRAIERGVYCSPRVPAGYRRTPSGRLAPDPKSAPALAEAFQLRAAGTRMIDVARYLHTQGTLSSLGNSGWSAGAVQRILSNRVYLGELRYAGHLSSHRHPAITDRATWQAAQTPRQPQSIRPGINTLLGGLLRCAGCGRVMRSSTRVEPDGQRKTHYSCGIGFVSAGKCPAPASISAAAVEPFVERALLLASPRPMAPAAGEDAIVATRRAATTAAEALARYRDDESILDAIGDQRFVEGLRTRAARADRAWLAVATAERALQKSTMSRANVAARWPSLDVRARRAVIARAFDSIIVRRGTGGLLSDRVFPIRATQATTLVDGSRQFPFTPSRQERRFAMRVAEPPRLWSVERLRRELRTFTTSRASWPLFWEFHQAGRSDIHAQLKRRGGPAVWAPRLGLEVRQDRHDFAPWDEARIRATLEVLLAGGRAFPTTSEFREMGLSALNRHLQRAGGAERWANEFSTDLFAWPAQRPTRWTEEAIEARLRAMLSGHAVYPTRAEFATAGLSGLDAAIARGQGHDAWAARLGLPRPRRAAGRDRKRGPTSASPTRSVALPARRIFIRPGASSAPPAKSDSRSRSAEAPVTTRGPSGWGFIADGPPGRRIASPRNSPG